MFAKRNFLFDYSRLLPHLFAAALGMLYAWEVSHSAYVKTGLQFVAPLLVIMGAHLIWIVFTQGLDRGFAHLVYQRSVKTAVGLAGIIILFSIYVPMPAHGTSGSSAIGGIFTFIICLAIMAVVIGVIALFLYSLFKWIASAWSAINRNRPGPGDSRMFDFGSIVLMGGLLAGASLEGLPEAYSFKAKNDSTATYYISASPAKVWDTMEKATSSKFPLPDVLHIFPQPVAVLVDEGTALHAKRVVKIKGREGEGYLELQVVERTQNTAVFHVIADTSPIANWVKHKTLRYTVLPEGEGTNLKVTLAYDRLLAPAWFFTPAIKVAAFLAMDVLARDVKARAEF